MSFLKPIFISLTAILLAFPLNGIAQKDCEQVVARSGVNIRETPSISGKKLMTVPYLECLEMLESRYYDLNDPIIQEKVVEVSGLKGRWLKVRYSGVTGYAFDALFGRFVQSDKPSTPWGIWQENGYCNTVFYPKGSYKNHYAFVHDGNSNWQLVKVELDYYFTTPDECSPEPSLNLKTTHPKQSELILGLDQELKLGPVVTYGGEEFGDLMFEVDANGKDEIELPKGQGKFDVTFLGKDVQYITFSKHGISQSIDMCAPDQSFCHHNPYGALDDVPTQYVYIQLRWAGDLDGDGKTDFLLDGELTDYMVKDLWLSSLAKPGQLVGRAGRFFHWYCC